MSQARPYQSECPSWEETDNYVEYDEEEEMILMTNSELKGLGKEEIWYLGVKAWLFEFDEIFRGICQARFEK
ncbi:hypothetical protein KIW84_036150 [Lathyrus oleraceus]|uniref:Uncharacterized protein n=1 Tax=Pisum sativum TaxID=3888 RepID=A0A9D5B7R2_PEA|nr:hypothetical protein KIW84_036150 [Pisum sativum]